MVHGTPRIIYPYRLDTRLLHRDGTTDDHTDKGYTGCGTAGCTTDASYRLARTDGTSDTAQRIPQTDGTPGYNTSYTPYTGWPPDYIIQDDTSVRWMVRGNNTYRIQRILMARGLGAGLYTADG